MQCIQFRLRFFSGFSETSVPVRLAAAFSHLLQCLFFLPQFIELFPGFLNVSSRFSILVGIHFDTGSYLRFFHVVFYLSIHSFDVWNRMFHGICNQFSGIFPHTHTGRLLFQALGFFCHAGNCSFCFRVSPFDLFDILIRLCFEFNLQFCKVFCHRFHLLPQSLKRETTSTLFCLMPSLVVPRGIFPPLFVILFQFFLFECLFFFLEQCRIILPWLRKRISFL